MNIRGFSRNPHMRPDFPIMCQYNLPRGPMALVALVAGEGSPREGGQVWPGGGAQVVPQQALAASTCRALRGLASFGDGSKPVWVDKDPLTSYFRVITYIPSVPFLFLFGFNMEFCWG